MRYHKSDSMKIANYNPSVNNAFVSDGRNPKFVGASFDYSFVGVAPSSGGFKKVVTAVGENKIVAAKHYKLFIGDPVEFFNRDNKKVVVRVVSEEFIDDVYVATVDQNWANLNVTPAIIGIYTNAAYKSKPTLTFGIEDAGKNVVAGITTVYQGQTKITAVSQKGGVSVDNGDSGAPNFVIAGSQLELIGPHYSISPTYFYSSIVGAYAAKLSV